MVLDKCVFGNSGARPRGQGCLKRDFISVQRGGAAVESDLSSVIELVNLQLRRTDHEDSCDSLDFDSLYVFNLCVGREIET